MNATVATTAVDGFTLDDGTAVDVHAMDPRDAAALVEFHSGLSEDTTYLRYFTIHPELSDDEVERFTHVDHRDREALVATVDGHLVAVARFDRVEGTADAEVAFVVDDLLQGRGIGRQLFNRLAVRARQVPRAPRSPTASPTSPSISSAERRRAARARLRT
jgi:GNAT superfamily N-acetyltransferase